MENYILAILMSLPVHSFDRSETPEHRHDRLAIASYAIWQASQIHPSGVTRQGMSEALIATGWAESLFASYVGEGRCHDGPPGARCDEDADGHARARSYWQVWSNTCPDVWRKQPGSKEEAQTAAECAANILVARWNECRNGWIGAFSRYASSTCEWKSVGSRLSLLSVVRSKFAKAQASD